MNTLLQILLLILPTLIHLVHDARQINGGTSPKHGRNLAILIGLSVAFAFANHYWANQEVNIWQYFFLAGAIHFTFFNYLLNFFRKPRKPFFYLADGPFDSAMKWIITHFGLMGYLFIQGFVLVTAFMTYFFPTGY